MRGCLAARSPCHGAHLATTRRGTMRPERAAIYQRRPGPLAGVLFRASCQRRRDGSVRRSRESESGLLICCNNKIYVYYKKGRDKKRYQSFRGLAYLLRAPAALSVADGVVIHTALGARGSEALLALRACACACSQATQTRRGGGGHACKRTYGGVSKIAVAIS